MVSFARQLANNLLISGDKNEKKSYTYKNGENKKTRNFVNLFDIDLRFWTHPNALPRLNKREMQAN